MSDLEVRRRSRTKIAVTFFLENYIHGDFLCVTTNVPTINPVEIITGKLIGKKLQSWKKNLNRMVVRRHILVDLMIFSELLRDDFLVGVANAPISVEGAPSDQDFVVHVRR